MYLRVKALFDSQIIFTEHTLDSLHGRDTNAYKKQGLIWGISFISTLVFCGVPTHSPGFLPLFFLLTCFSVLDSIHLRDPRWRYYHWIQHVL